MRLEAKGEEIVRKKRCPGGGDDFAAAEHGPIDLRAWEVVSLPDGRLAEEPSRHRSKGEPMARLIPPLQREVPKALGWV